MSKDWEYMGDHILGKVRYNKRPVLVPMDLAMGLLGGGLSNGRIGSLGVGKWARM